LLWNSNDLDIILIAAVLATIIALVIIDREL
jgi:hypothetical protein